MIRIHTAIFWLKNSLWLGNLKAVQFCNVFWNLGVNGIDSQLRGNKSAVVSKSTLKRLKTINDRNIVSFAPSYTMRAAA